MFFFILQTLRCNVSRKVCHSISYIIYIIINQLKCMPRKSIVYFMDVSIYSVALANQ